MASGVYSGIYSQKKTSDKTNQKLKYAAASTANAVKSGISNLMNLSDDQMRLLSGQMVTNPTGKAVTSSAHTDANGVHHGGSGQLSFGLPGVEQTQSRATTKTTTPVTGIPYATEQDYLNSLGLTGLGNASPTSFINLKYGAGTSDALKSASGGGASRGLYGTDGSGTGLGASTFAPSQTYQQAMAYTKQLLDQLSSGRTSYTDKINSLMSQIEGRDPFSYDANSDPLFQSYLQMMMGSGQQAMQDTMGQAAALSGGYGSSYATAAGNQAYNSMVQDAYNSMPDYYNAALSAYDAEGNRLASQLGMYQTADDAEYQRLASAYSANAQNAAQLYDQEFNAYQQAVAQDQWQKQYDYTVGKNAASASSSSSGSAETKAVTSDIAKRLQEVSAKYGADSQQVDEFIATYENMGYGFDELANIADSTTKSSPTLDKATGQYVDGAGNVVDEAPVFYLQKGKKGKDDSVYVDKYDNTYTYQQIKSYGLTKNIKTN